MLCTPGILEKSGRLGRPLIGVSPKRELLVSSRWWLTIVSLPITSPDELIAVILLSYCLYSLFPSEVSYPYYAAGLKDGSYALYESKSNVGEGPFVAWLF